jgi:chemotaxis protein CheD
MSAQASLLQPGDAPGRRHVVQGAFAVSAEPDMVLTTVLGSCVAACAHDPQAEVGGMNHFLLPGEDADSAASESLRYGVQAMELLLNGLYRLGARRERLRVKLFGGARLIGGLTDIGEQNARFAERFLAKEGIALTASSLGGDHARRLQFWPACGRVRQMILRDRSRAVFEAERKAPARVEPGHGAVEMFW